MRVHHLEITAFGPFAGTESIDFDQLNESGIFLLTGPTGAGKTSVLDAICFGLFGSVPGGRNNAKSLKSHHAAADVQPVIELEFSVHGRRLRIRRSPAWTKPSRRAKSGSVDHHAKAVAMELVDGEWVARSNRIDEVGHLVSRVLGMNRDQFCQVVMLPQGQFQTFLNAGAKERHDVLEALFETGRFQRIEKWLAEHRRATEREFAAHEVSLRSMAARVEEANAQPLHPDGADLAELPLDQIQPSIVHAATRVAVRSDELRAAAALAHSAGKVAEHALDEALQLRDKQNRYREAQQTLNDLDATADGWRERADEVARARAVLAVWPLVELADEAAERHRSAVDRVQQLVGSTFEAGLALPQPTVHVVSDELERLRRAEAAVAAVSDLEASVVTKQQALAEFSAAAVRLRERLAHLTSRSDALPAEQLAATARAEALQPMALGRLAAVEARNAATAAAAAAHLAARQEAELTVLDAAVTAAQAGALEAKESWLACREAYLDGIAAVLAGQLEPQRACPVCGGVEHPAPAVVAADDVTAEQESAAAARYAEADEALTAARRAQSDARVQLAEARTLSNALTPKAADAVAQQRDTAVREAEQAAAELELVGQQLATLASEATALAADVASTAGELTRIDAQSTSLVADVDREAALLAAALGAESTVQLRLAELSQQRERCNALLEALRNAQHLATTRDERAAGCAQALADTEFTSVDEVRSARMTEPEIANAETLIRAAADARAAAAKVLAEPGLATAAAAAEPDLSQVTAARDQARAELAERSQALARELERLDRLDRLGADFASSYGALTPLRQARDLAAQVAAMCSGTSTDNLTRTRLSHFVLSQRLRQVVEAANSRLAGISGGRYELRHTMQRGVGDTRGGLGLQVDDSYTGQARDPATLSGGETFYVSLALALGLADLVRDEIGGVELSTLFVDEGFGGLDADTLDEVMDTLDALRSGGRAVGIVSHVQDLRLRIPAQLQVSPSSQGSRLVAT